MVAVERARYHVRPERPGRVEGAAGVVHADELGDEQGESDPDGSEEGRLVLLGSEEEDGEHEHRLERDKNGR